MAVNRTWKVVSAVLRRASPARVTSGSFDSASASPLAPADNGSSAFFQAS